MNQLIWIATLLVVLAAPVGAAHLPQTDLPPRTIPLFKSDLTPLEGKADTAVATYRRGGMAMSASGQED